MTRLTVGQKSFLAMPDVTVEEYRARFPEDTRSAEAIARAHRRYKSEDAPAMLYPKADDPAVEWDKKLPDVSWRDYVRVYEEVQDLNERAAGSQDTARIRVLTQPGQGVPIGMVSDFHFGSWGTSMRRIEEITDRLQRLGIRLGVLGDMVQMSIRLRGIIEISDNMLTPRQQVHFLELWLAEMAPQILWSVWDNHAVQREEDATGFSYYAELFKRCSIYHSGIGHIDLEVTDGEHSQLYKIASSHRFRGNTSNNPLNGSIKYMRFHGIDREIAIAGDSHVPEIRAYADGPMPRLAINCGSLQTDSGYAKRNFTPYTHSWMPVVVFYPDTHLMVPYQDLDHYEREQERLAA